MATRVGESAIDEVRDFNRFYTRAVGALNEGLLDSPWSLTEVRVMYEIANRQAVTAAELAKDLALDPGYLSRILQRFRRRRLVRRTQSRNDRRASVLSLTAEGNNVFRTLDARARAEVADRLEKLGAEGQQEVVSAMRTIRELLDPGHTANRGYVLRAPKSGDLGWVVHRHGVLYAEEFGWDARFEGLVAEIVADFARENDPKRERCWIAERNGRTIGSVFLVRRSARVAQLRLLLVEPSARGLGLGARLVDECISFARSAGYSKMMLWTHSNLVAARDLYRRRGFTIRGEERYHAFGHALVSETWELKL